MSIHLVVGGYPAGQHAGHDMNTVRRRLLDLLAEHPRENVTVANDFADLHRWLPVTKLLVTYTAGPYPDGDNLAALDAWLDEGGRWLALHGSAGGRAVPVVEGGQARRMAKTGHHRTLGAFFLNHPPIRRFTVEVAPGAAQANPSATQLLANVPLAFDTADELYLIEVTDPQATVLLTTDLAVDPTPERFGFVVPQDTSLLADGRRRALGTLRLVERGDQNAPGGVAYLALGHCHGPGNNIQPFVDASVVADGTTPPSFTGSWDTEGFAQLLRNGIAWGLGVVSDG